MILTGKSRGALITPYYNGVRADVPYIPRIDGTLDGLVTGASLTYIQLRALVMIVRYLELVYKQKLIDTDAGNTCPTEEYRETYHIACIEEWATCKGLNIKPWIDAYGFNIYAGESIQIEYKAIWASTTCVQKDYVYQAIWTDEFCIESTSIYDVEWGTELCTQFEVVGTGDEFIAIWLDGECNEVVWYYEATWTEEKCVQREESYIVRWETGKCIQEDVAP